MTDNDVGFVDTVVKSFEAVHTYVTRGLYTVTVTGFDERSYAEESLDVTIFRMPCKVPQVSSQSRTNKYRSCAALLVISNPLKIQN